MFWHVVACFPTLLERVMHDTAHTARNTAVLHRAERFVTHRGAQERDVLLKTRPDRSARSTPFRNVLHQTFATISVARQQPVHNANDLSHLVLHIRHAYAIKLYGVA